MKSCNVREAIQFYFGSFVSPVHYSFNKISDAEAKWPYITRNSIAKCKPNNAKQYTEANTLHYKAVALNFLGVMRTWFLVQCVWARARGTGKSFYFGEWLFFNIVSRWKVHFRKFLAHFCIVTKIAISIINNCFKQIFGWKKRWQNVQYKYIESHRSCCIVYKFIRF